MSKAEFALPKLDCGELITYLLPGLPFLAAVAYVSPEIDQVWNGILSGQGSAGVYVAAILLALSGGLLLSILRRGVECLVLMIPLVDRKMRVDCGQLGQDGKARYCETLRHGDRHARLAGNMALASLALFLARWLGRFPKPWAWDLQMWIVLAGAAVLCACAVLLFIDSRRAIRNVLGQE